MLSSVQDKKNAGTAGWQIALRNFTRFFVLHSRKYTLYEDRKYLKFDVLA